MDWKKVLDKRTLVVMGLITLVVLIFVQQGIFKYDTMQKDKKEFLENERLKVENYKRVEEFGAIGLKLFFIPDPAIIFFSDSAVNLELIARINSADVLDMDRSFLGKKMFSNKKGGFKDFSGIIILLVGAAVLYLGIGSFYDLEFLKSLAGISGTLKIYLLLIFSRMLLIVVFLFFISACSLGLVWLNRIILPGQFFYYMSLFFALMAGVILFFYGLGTVLGTFTNRNLSILLAIGLWFLLIFLVPEGIDSIVEKQAEKINSNFKYELDKIRHEMGFEKRGQKELEKYVSKEERNKVKRVLVDSYQTNEASSIEKLEQEREAAMRKLLKTHKMLSLFFPSSFYISTSHSVSSSGYESSIEFYRYTYLLKPWFIRWYIKQRYDSDGGKPPHFIKGDENVFYSKSCLGQYFTLGLILVYFYVFLLSWYAYKRLKNEMYGLIPKDIRMVSKKEIQLEKKKFSPWRTNGHQLKNLLFVLFSGEIKKLRERGYTGRITMDNVDVSNTRFIDKFLYICRPADVPGDIKISDWLYLISALMKLPAIKTREFMNRLEIQPHLAKKFKELKDLEKSEILLSLVDLGNYCVYLVNDIAAGLSRDFFLSLNDRLEALAQEGAVVLYLSSVYIPIQEKDIKDRENQFFPDNSWPHDIALIKRLNKIKSTD